MTPPDFKFLCKKAGLEVGLDNHLHLKLGPAHLPHQGNHPERQRDVLGGAVPEHREDKISLSYSVSSPHEFMLAVWWDEADSVLSLELTQLDAPER